MPLSLESLTEKQVRYCKLNKIPKKSILEGNNPKRKLTKEKARGYRNMNNFITMIYFLCSKLSELSEGIYVGP